MVANSKEVEKPAKMDDSQIKALRAEHEATFLRLARQDLEETYPVDPKTGKKFVTDEVVQATSDYALVRQFGRTHFEHTRIARDTQNVMRSVDPVEERVKQKIEEASTNNYLSKSRTLAKIYGSAERVRYAFRGLSV
jgi:hypothetical protein